MRVNRLDLTRYGKFTDRSIDFGSKPKSGADLHMVFGANEAGKSTLFAAMLDLFYGIPTQSPYNFLHGYDTMRIGATLHAEGRERSFIRVKKKQGLLDGEERPLPEAAMAGLLAGLGREACRTMFSLDAETLKQGGRDILASKGDLGQLLFSASAGLADLSRNLAGIEEELDGFHTTRATKSRLADMRREAERLKAEREAADVSAATYRQLEEALRQAEEADVKAGEDFRAAADRAARIETLLDAHRLAAERAKLAAEAAAAAAQAEALAPALNHAETAAELNQQAVVYRKALDDLPNRQAECAQAESAVRGLLAHLRRPDETHPRRLILDAMHVTALKDLIGRRAALEAKLEAARQSHREAAKRLTESEAALAEAGGAAGRGLDRVRAAVDALRQASPGVRRRQAESLAARHRASLDDAIEALAPWRGDAADLAALDAPDPSEVSATGAEIVRAVHSEQSARQAWERAAAVSARVQAELAALGDPTALRDGADHAVIRAAREGAWAAHRKTLDDGTADAFAAAMRRDDAAMEARLMLSGMIARAAELRLSAAAADAEVNQSVQALKSAESAAADARAKLARMIEALSPAFKPTMSDVALNAWLKRRDDALGLRRQLREAERDAVDARRLEQDLLARLSDALAAAGAPQDDGAEASAMGAAADALLRAAERVEALKAGVERATRDAADRRAALDAAEAETIAWEAAWRQAVAACWLGELEPAPDTALAAGVLEALVRLQGALDTRADRLDRLQKIERDIVAFTERTAALAAGFGLEIGDPLAALRMVQARMDAARQAASARDRLTERCADAGRSLLQSLKAASLAEADAMLAGLDAESLAAEQADLAMRLPVLDKARLEAFSALTAARRAIDAVGGDAAAARLAAMRANLMLRIEDEASRHLALRLGVMAVRQALRSYRDRHRSSMLRSASEAFAVMTRGAYTGLAAQADGGVEKLVAIARDGASREADQLSTGTQYQLYLALRVAGHREFARERPPLPFVCDDILETFDDLRAEEALKLLAGMAEHGQVICLTHHRHIVEIARQVCPSVKAHEL